METRDIFNKNGVKIGELRLESGLSEEVWQERLSAYLEQQPAYLPNITPRQIRQALTLYGISLTDIDNALNSLPEPTKSLAKIEWEYSVAFIRQNPLVEQVGQMLGWTSDQLDDLWKFASKL